MWSFLIVALLPFMDDFFASRSVGKSLSFKHSFLKLPLKVSTNAFYMGLKG